VYSARDGIGAGGRGNLGKLESARPAAAGSDRTLTAACWKRKYWRLGEPRAVVCTED
jgi:hypothetical protein